VITLFRKRAGSIEMETIHAGDPIPGDVLWIDLYNPTAEEEVAVEQQLDVEILTREEVWKNQVLNRFYTEDGVSYMTSAIITKVDTPYPQTSAVTFVRAENYLLTIRYIMPTSFNNFSHRLAHGKRSFITGSEVLEGLLEEIITRVAYNSEIVVNELDKLSHDIFGANVLDTKKSNQTLAMKAVLKRLGASADLNSQISESLHSISRMLVFFRQIGSNGPEVNAGIDTLIADVNSLIAQTSFLADKITFQLDATLGVINVEQNQIVKVFTILAVFFMPPTLISSIYGMNFRVMPELDWSIGYPIAIALMTTSAFGPFMYFKKKGWL
jgi:magnesium transporter